MKEIEKIHNKEEEEEEEEEQGMVWYGDLVFFYLALAAMKE